MTITETIQSNANLPTLAAAEDWAAIVAAWPSIRLPDVRVSGKATAEGLIAAGHDWIAITTAFHGTVPGQDLKTIMQSQDGINWADTMTVGVLGSLKNDVMTQGVIDTLVSLSQRFAVVPTADEVEAAWNQSILEAKQQALFEVWTTLLNDGGINVAVADGDQAALKAALIAAADAIGGA